VLLILPHVVGAPQPDVHGGLAPPELSQQFIQATILVNAVFWLALGVFSALTYRRFVFVAKASM
jgi:predicted cobalt transporter CbtA